MTDLKQQGKDISDAKLTYSDMPASSGATLKKGVFTKAGGPTKYELVREYVVDHTKYQTVVGPIHANAISM